MEEVGPCGRHPVRPVLPLPEEEGPEGGIEVEEGSAEERKVVGRKPPQGPSEAVKEAHRKTHLPFRPWCPVCVAGRGRNWPHPRVEEDREEKYPSVHFDYCFLRDDQGGPKLPVLVGRDKECGALLAHAVPEKGAGLEWTGKQVVKDLLKLGIRGKVILRADQEPALAALVEGVAKERGEESTVVEWSPKGESQANGRAERGVQTLEGLARTHKLELEEKLMEKVPVDSPVFAWLIEHVADIHNKFHVYPDGTTAYERIKGRRYQGEMLEFGQIVMHRIPGKPQGGLMQPRWLTGVWLGKRFSSEEHILAMGDGKVVRSRAVRSVPKGTMWNAVEVKKIIGLPWKPSGEITGSGESIPPMPRAIDVKPEESVEGPKARSMKIMPKHIGEAGYTRGCRKCEAIQRGGHDGVSLGHSAACRKRMEEAVRKNDNMKKDVERAEVRKNEYLSKQVEQAQEESESKRQKKNEVTEVAEPQESSSRGGNGASSSSSGNTEVRAEDQPVPDDDGDIELEECDTEEQGTQEKRKREEEDDGGEDAPAMRYRQLPAEEPVRPTRLRDEDSQVSDKAPRRTEREAYARDMQMMKEDEDKLDLLGMTE